MKFLHLFFLIIGISFNVFSKSADSYVFKHLSVEDGLSNNFIKSIYKDQFGYLWFGTLDGIDRYDGAEIRSFNQYFPKDVNSVTSIIEDGSNKVWIGTESGLFYWDRIAGFFNKINDEKIVHSNIGKIIRCGMDSLLFFSGKNFFYVNPYSLELHSLTFHKATNSLLNYITDFCVDGDQLYISTEGGFIQYDLTSRCSLLYDKSYYREIGDVQFSCIAKHESNLYFGTHSNGLICFNLETRKFSKLTGFNETIILSLAYSNNSLYVGTDSNGLLVYNTKNGEIKRIEHVDNHPSSISSNAVYSLLIDEKETLWTGTYAGGVSYSSLKDNTFKIYNSHSNFSLFNKSIRSLCFYDSVRFIGTRDGLYVKDKQDKVNYFSVDNSPLKAKIILSIFEHNGSVFIGTYGGGLYKYSFKTKQLEEWKEKWFKGQCIYAFECDRYGNFWIGTLTGIYKVKGDVVMKYDSENHDLQDDLIYALKIDTLNRLWVGTSKALKVFDIGEEKFNLVSGLSSLEKTKYSCFYNDSKNKMWAAAEKYGLYCINNHLEVELHILKKDGLCDNSVSSIIESDSGEYWISTLKGVTRFKKKENSFDNFFFSNGLPGLVFNPNAVIKDESGCIWFGNEKGLVYFDPNAITDKATESNLLITDIYIGGKAINNDKLKEKLDVPVEKIKILKLSGKDNNIGFRFVNLFVPHAIESRYAVKLEKDNESKNEWIKLDYQGKVFYNSLKPGEYGFYMGIIDSADSVVPNSIKVLKIHIASEWYQSFAVLIAIILILLCFTFIFIYLIKSAQKKLKLSMAQHENSGKEKYEFSRLDELHSSKLFTEIQDYIETSKLFLNPELKIGDLANLMNYSSQGISQAINQNFGQGFTDFINYYRVNKIKNNLKDPVNMHLTLPAIAEKSGFNSKSSFYRAFKKVTGQTPAEYWTEIQKK